MYDYSWNVEFLTEPDDTDEVYQAWQRAGGGENYPTVARLPDLGKWGVGFGGTKNGERAAKLALAASIAIDSDKTAEIVWEYPKF